MRNDAIAQLFPFLAPKWTSVVILGHYHHQTFSAVYSGLQFLNHSLAIGPN